MPRCSDSDTEELLARIRGGDRLAAEELFARHRARLRRMVKARTDERLAGRIDPSDVVQDAMVVACRRLPEYLENPRIPFYPWLRRIAWDRLVQIHRQQDQAAKRSVRQEESLGLSDASAIELAQCLASSKSGPAGRLLRKELRARVRAMLARLTETDREVLILKHLEELGNHECAAVLGISVEAVKKRYLRALVRVRELMDDGSWE